MTVNKLNAGGQSINTKSYSSKACVEVNIFLRTYARSVSFANSGSIPERSTVEGIIDRFEILVLCTAS